MTDSSINSKMKQDFFKEGFQAGLEDRTVVSSIWHYASKRFLNKFISDHPEYAQFINEYPLKEFTERGEFFKDLYANPDFVAHVEGLLKLCKEFDEKHPQKPCVD